MAQLVTITPETILKRNDERFITSPIGDEIVMMSVESGNYIGINEVSAEIWNALAEAKKVTDLVDHLCGIYDISKDSCTAKTIEHLNEMAAEDMVLIVG